MSLATTDIQFLCDLVADESGNVISERQVYLLEQKLSQVAKSKGLDNVDGLVTKLRKSKDPKLCSEIAEAVTINETSFFRDSHPFESLKKAILPELMKRRGNTKSIRIWCAACSTGQEPYSIVMTCKELAELENWNLSILATDICEEVLDKSKQGIYSQLEVNRGLPAKKLVMNFDRKGRNWQVKSELRKKIRFQRLNLMQPLPMMGQFDIIFIRNVLIYFDKTSRQQILQKISKQLMPDGYLFIGSAETLIGLDLPYQRKEINGTICYQCI